MTQILEPPLAASPCVLMYIDYNEVAWTNGKELYKIGWHSYHEDHKQPLGITTDNALFKSKFSARHIARYGFKSILKLVIEGYEP